MGSNLFFYFKSFNNFDNKIKFENTKIKAAEI